MPGSGVTEMVARAWREVLDDPSLAQDMPFGQAGGDSLKMIKLIFLVEAAGNIRLPMEACNSGLRPSALVELVRSALQPNRESSTEPPGTVFLIPGLGGETPLEGGFRPACSPALRIVTADLPDWPEMIAPDFAMDDLIDRIATEIGARAPAGAITLAGYSFGGHVAFGIARALVTRGHEIALLAILDTDTVIRQEPVPHGPAPIRALRQFRWDLHNLLRAWRRGATADWVGEVAARFLARPGRGRRLRVATHMWHLPLPTDFAMFVNIYLREILQARMLRAWRTSPSYRAAQLDAPVVLFRSQEHRNGESSDLGWGEVCSQLRVIDVRGGHKTMLLAPYVAELSARFVQAVQESVR